MDELFLALRVAVSLAAVLGIIWYAQRRISRGTRAKGSTKTITVVGRQGVGAKASVAVIEVDGKRFLLGVTEQSVSILHTSDAPEAPAEAFGRVLHQQTAGDDALAITSPGLQPAPQSRLAGSLLSAETWRRAIAALRP